MESTPRRCPDCDDARFDRRDFLKTAAVAASSLPLWATPIVQAAPTPTSPAETAVKGLYESLTDEQKNAICFDWDHKDARRGLLRNFVSNNWLITEQPIRSDFYSKKQQAIIHDIWSGIINPEWHARFLKQLKDDTDGKDWGHEQAIAIFGKPGTEKFGCVITGRHMTLRADGHSEKHVAFGGPIFYGHAASGFNEKVGHPHNVFWPQAQAANLIFQMMDGKQRDKALVLDKRPRESAIAFQGDKGKFPGIPVADLTDDQKAELQRVLRKLIEPFRKEDQDEALECLKKLGGLDRCGLAFYKDGDLGDDGEWDNWRLEGPAFVWYFRGTPHVHVWVNVADDPSMQTNARG
jgi:hypothetical protein